MKRPNTNSPLDNFLKEKLNSSEGNTPVIDWSEMEVLLGAEQKPISVALNRQQIVIAAIIVVACAGIWGIFKTVQYIRSLPDEIESQTDSLPSSFNIEEPSIHTATASVAVTTDTARLDSTELLERKTDSVLKAADVFLNKISSQQTFPADPSFQQSEKKKKQKKNKDGSVPVDSSALTAPVEQVPAPDTAQHRIPEVKQIIADTAKSNAPPKTGKSKKGKNKKNTASGPDPIPPSPDPLPSQPDSLK